MWQVKYSLQDPQESTYLVMFLTLSFQVAPQDFSVSSELFLGSQNLD